MRFFICAAIAAATVLGLGRDANAQQSYPIRPITIVVPFAAGGPTDVLARILGQHMSQTLGQQIVVENVTGGGGSIGAARVAKAAPDGYTLVMGNLGSHAASVGLYKDLSYDPRIDFEPVMLVASTPMVLVVRTTLQTDTLKSFIDYAATNPHKLTFGSAGTGSISHLTYLLFTHLTKTEIQHVPYRGLSQAVNDLLSGQIDLMFDQVVSATPHILAGGVKAIAVTAPRRARRHSQSALLDRGGLARAANHRLDRPVLPKGDAEADRRARQCGGRQSHARRGRRQRGWRIWAPICPLPGSARRRHSEIWFEARSTSGCR